MIIINNIQNFSNIRGGANPPKGVNPPKGFISKYAFAFTTDQSPLSALSHIIQVLKYRHGICAILIHDQRHAQ